MLTTEQIRSARAALDWSLNDLANACGLGHRTLTKIEAQTGVPDARSSTLLKIQQALEDAGIEFIGTPDEAPGIRLHKTPRPR